MANVIISLEDEITWSFVFVCTENSCKIVYKKIVVIAFCIRTRLRGKYQIVENYFSLLLLLVMFLLVVFDKRHLPKY